MVRGHRTASLIALLLGQRAGEDLPLARLPGVVLLLDLMGCPTAGVLLRGIVLNAWDLLALGEPRQLEEGQGGEVQQLSASSAGDPVRKVQLLTFTCVR